MGRLFRSFMLLLVVSCAHNEGTFNYERHCSSEGLRHIKELQALDLQKKHKRGAITPQELKKLVRLNAALDMYAKDLKTPFFECFAEYERQGGKRSFAVCTVTVTDSKGKIAFLEAEDAANQLEAGLKSCLQNRIRAVDFAKYPDLTIIQAIEMDNLFTQ